MEIEQTWRNNNQNQAQMYIMYVHKTVQRWYEGKMKDAEIPIEHLHALLISISLITDKQEEQTNERTNAGKQATFNLFLFL